MPHSHCERHKLNIWGQGQQMLQCDCTNTTTKLKAVGKTDFLNGKIGTEMGQVGCMQCHNVLSY